MASTPNPPAKPADDPHPQPTEPAPGDEETDTERDNRKLRETRDRNAGELADHDGIGGKGRMPDAQALTRPGPGDPVPSVESVVDPDRPASPE